MEIGKGVWEQIDPKNSHVHIIDDWDKIEEEWIKFWENEKKRLYKENRGDDSYSKL